MQNFFFPLINKAADIFLALGCCRIFFFQNRPISPPPTQNLICLYYFMIVINDVQILIHKWIVYIIRLYIFVVAVYLICTNIAITDYCFGKFTTLVF